MAYLTACEGERGARTHDVNLALHPAGIVNEQNETGPELSHSSTGAIARAAYPNLFRLYYIRDEQHPIPDMPKFEFGGRMLQPSYSTKHLTVRGMKYLRELRKQKEAAA
jgi:hypothetical protein